MKFLFVTQEALSVDLAWQLQKEGHEVRFFVQSQNEKDVGDGFITKVEEWVSHKDWADVVVFDDIGFGPTAEKLRSEGKAVVGGTPYTDRLENDREFGQEELRKAGVNTLPGWNFTSFDEAIAFIRQNPDRYVIKPSGTAQNEKELLFVGQEDDGKDVVQVLEHYRNKWSSKIKAFLLQKYAYGVEIAVGAFFNGSDFVEPINVNFEHKRLFPNDIGPSTGEMGCYDDKTEVLTSRGWLLFKDLELDDDVCTLNSSTQTIEYQKPSAVVSFAHHKRLISIRNEALDIMVTPDHNMYVESAEDARLRREKFGFVRARELEARSLVKRSGVWIGTEQTTFKLPSVAVTDRHGPLLASLEAREVEVPMDAWLAFFGRWLSGGCSSGASGSYRAGIDRRPGPAARKVEALLAGLPFRFSSSGAQLVCDDEQLGAYLSGLGTVSVPGFVKRLSPRQISIFLGWFAEGDEAPSKRGRRVFRTESKELADDLQELLLKVGRVGVIRTLSRSGRRRDFEGAMPRCQYQVVESVRRLHSRVDGRDVRVVDYAGTVHCATVGNHVMYVRRNGKACWCGNTSMYWSKRTPVFEMTLGKMKEPLKASRYVGYVDINCIANQKGVWPLEFTTRFGYPTISIQMEGVASEWGTLLADIAQGKQTQLRCKKGYQVGVVVAVPPFPFEDEKAFRKYSEDATILFKKPNLNGVHIGEVKLDEGDWKLAGRSGYALVITGSGFTMQEAINQAYQQVKNVMIPNMFYRDDVGRRWFRDSDMLLAWGYL